MRHLLALALIGALTTTLLAPSSQAAPVTTAAQPLSVTSPTLYSGTVLFVDDHRIARTTGLQRNYVAGTKVQVDALPRGQVQIKPIRIYRGADDAADGDTDIDSLYLTEVSTVLRDVVDGVPLYRMWLRSGDHVGYRESQDGLHWHTRDPDSVIVVRDLSSPSVMRDAESGLYYMTGWQRTERRYLVYVSRDGVTWRQSVMGGNLSTLPGDVIKSAFDPVTRRIITIAKEKTLVGPKCAEGLFGGGRTFGTQSRRADTADDRTTRLDWVHSSQPRLTATCTDAFSVPPTKGTSRPAQVYGVAFQRWGDQYLGLLWFFRVTTPPPSPTESGLADGPIDTQVAATVDPVKGTWRRADATTRVGGRSTRAVMIPRGPAGSWDDGMVFGQSLVQEDKRTLGYYSGWNTEHRPQFGQQVKTGAVQWQRDRFVGMKVRREGAGWASLTTTRLSLPSNAAGRTLYVNARVPSPRSMQVAVVDGATGRAVPGYGFADSTVVRGDHLDAAVRWRAGGIGRLRAKSIRLVFRYTGGSLYGFRVS